MRKRMSLRTHLAVAIAILNLLVAVAVGIMVTRLNSRQLEAEAGSSLSLAASQSLSRLDGLVRSKGAQVGALASALQDRRSVLNEDSQPYLDAIRREDPLVAWLGITDTEGNVLFSTQSLLKGENISERPIFQKALVGRYYGDVHPAVRLAALLGPDAKGRPTSFIDASSVFYDKEGLHPAGVVAMHLDWNATRDYLAIGDRSSEATAGLTTILLDRDGHPLIAPDTLMKDNYPLSPGLKGRFPVTERWSVQTWGDGREYIVGEAKGGVLGWTMMVGKPLDEAHEPIRATAIKAVLWSLALSIGFSILGWVAAGYISRPLRSIAASAERLRLGERGGTIAPYGGSREVEELSASLRGLVASLVSQESALAFARGEADQDALTGLPNRRFFERHVAALSCQEGDPGVAFAYIDLDKFKPINDTYGHAAGDMVLKEAARRIQGCLRNDDLVARIGGDEFTAILAGNRSREAVAGVAMRIVRSLQEPVVLEEGVSVTVGCCVGVAMWRADAENLDTVLEMADQVLYDAKRAGGGHIGVVGMGLLTHETPIMAT